MDRFDALELVGVLLVSLAAALVAIPLGLLVLGVACVVQAELRSVAPGPAPDEVEGGSE